MSNSCLIQIYLKLRKAKTKTNQKVKKNPNLLQKVITLLLKEFWNKNYLRKA